MANSDFMGSTDIVFIFRCFVMTMAMAMGEAKRTELCVHAARVEALRVPFPFEAQTNRPTSFSITLSISILPFKEKTKRRHFAMRYYKLVRQ